VLKLWKKKWGNSNKRVRRRDRDAEGVEGGEVSPPQPTRRSGEHRKLPQRALGRSPSRNWIWCILAIKSGFWWQFVYESDDGMVTQSMRSNFEIHGNGKSRILWKHDLFRVDGQFHNNQSSLPGLPEVGKRRSPLEKSGERRSPRSSSI